MQDSETATTKSDKLRRAHITEYYKTVLQASYSVDPING